LQVKMFIKKNLLGCLERDKKKTKTCMQFLLKIVKVSGAYTLLEWT